MRSDDPRRAKGAWRLLAACAFGASVACSLDERAVGVADGELLPGAGGAAGDSAATANAGSLGQAGAAGAATGSQGSADDDGSPSARGGAAGGVPMVSGGTNVGGGRDDAGAAGSNNPGGNSAASCSGDADCASAAVCTSTRCQGGACVSEPAAAGTPCGSASDDACTHPDSCDALGICQRNDELVGTTCPGGTCIGGQCSAVTPSTCAVDSVDRVPVMLAWSSVGRPNLYDGGCDSQGTPEYALVFTPPLTGTYRIAATALVDGVPYTGAGNASGTPAGPADGDAVMAVAQGNCTGFDAAQIACNDDVSEGNINSQLDLQLTAQRPVTVYLNELTQTGGGSGRLSITLLP